jgi:hypothetical protein
MSKSPLGRATGRHTHCSTDPWAAFSEIAALPPLLGITPDSGLCTSQHPCSLGYAVVQLVERGRSPMRRCPFSPAPACSRDAPSAWGTYMARIPKMMMTTMISMRVKPLSRAMPENVWLAPNARWGWRLEAGSWKLRRLFDLLRASSLELSLPRPGFLCMGPCSSIPWFS